MRVSFKIEGLKEVQNAFDELANDIGDKKARSSVLIPSVREAMKPVLAVAKTLAPKDTGELSITMQVEARRPTKKDFNSKYVSPKDTVIALVTTKSFSKRAKNKFYKENADLYKSDKAAYKSKLKSLKESKGILTDARAVAQEFGTARNPAHSYLIPALKSQAQQTAMRLGEILGRRINQYRAKT
jgi:hypothetical protein